MGEFSGLRALITGGASGIAAGRLDVLVNNAGIGAQGTVEDNDDETWHAVLDVNVVGLVRVTRAALPHRLVSAEEVAAAVCYLAGPAAGATTGTAPAVDGGMQGLRIPAR